MVDKMRSRKWLYPALIAVIYLTLAVSAIPSPWRKAKDADLPFEMRGIKPFFDNACTPYHKQMISGGWKEAAEHYEWVPGGGGSVATSNGYIYGRGK
jgi:hypothetical protein